MFHRKRGRHGREEKATPRPRFPIPEPGAPSATFASLAKFNEKCCYEVSGPPAGCGGTSAHRAAHPLQNAQRVGHPRGSSRLKDAPPAKIRVSDKVTLWHRQRPVLEVDRIAVQY